MQLDHSDYSGIIQSEGTTDIVLENGSTWTLTGNSTVSSVSGDLSGIDLNGYSLLINGEFFEV